MANVKHGSEMLPALDYLSNTAAISTAILLTTTLIYLPWTPAMCKLSNKINQTIVLTDKNGQEHIITSDVVNVYLKKEVIKGQIVIYDHKHDRYNTYCVIFSFVSYLWRMV